MTSACNLDEHRGARWAVYEIGMDIPSALYRCFSPFLYREDCSRLRRRMARYLQTIPAARTPRYPLVPGRADSACPLEVYQRNHANRGLSVLLDCCPSGSGIYRRRGQLPYKGSSILLNGPYLCPAVRSGQSTESAGYKRSATSANNGDDTGESADFLILEGTISL